MFSTGTYASLIAIEFVQKIYESKIDEIIHRKVHKKIFEKLLNTTLEYLHTSNIADILNWFNITYQIQSMYTMSCNKIN
jgi:ABC-type bacteriocin/lantibiotic exporter with double-glycine peptidase domain